MTVGQALAEYQDHLLLKGNKTSSRVNTLARLVRWFPDVDRPLAELRAAEVAAIYKRRSGAVATDTHRNELAEVKTWLSWCAGKGWLRSSPAEGLVGVGKRKRGKPQLRRGEAEKLLNACLEAYQGRRRGWEAGLGVAIALLLGMRASEVVGLQRRDVDDSEAGLLVWIDEAKTEAGRRYLEVPDVLVAPLLAQAEHAKVKGSAWLFPAGAGHRSKTWLRKAAGRLATAAGVPYVPPHGLRGTTATLSREGGATGHLVAQQLGHASVRQQEQAYLAPGALERARARWGAAQVGGG